jgi:hypothetical protein
VKQSDNSVKISSEDANDSVTSKTVISIEVIVFVGGNNNRFVRCDIKLVDKIGIKGEVAIADNLMGETRNFSTIRM